MKTKTSRIKPDEKTATDRIALKQFLTEIIKPVPAVLPVHNPEFASCSLAIRKSAERGGAPLALPSELLPPL